VLVLATTAHASTTLDGKAVAIAAILFIATPLGPTADSNDATTQRTFAIAVVALALATTAGATGRDPVLRKSLQHHALQLADAIAAVAGARRGLGRPPLRKRQARRTHLLRDPLAPAIRTTGAALFTQCPKPGAASADRIIQRNARSLQCLVAAFAHFNNPRSHVITSHCPLLNVSPRRTLHARNDARTIAAFRRKHQLQQPGGKRAENERVIVWATRFLFFVHGEQRQDRTS
jgi:hypothetical protein